jgi:creatinine amidohydrolase
MVDMTWPEVKAAADEKAIVLLPVAIAEEHGPQLDLSPDIYQTCLACRYMKKALAQENTLVVIAPPYYWGMSEVNNHIPGTFSVRAETFSAMLHDICSSLKSWGFTYVFFVNLHGDPTHNLVLDQAANSIRKELEIDVYNAQSLDKNIVNAPTYFPSRKGSYEPDYHAGATETATMYALYPQRVRSRLAETLKPESSFDPLGYVGDPASYKLERNATENLRITSEYGARIIHAFLQKEATE